MRYADGAAFRQALEQRLKARADSDGARIARDRKRVAFDRFLARLVAVATGQWLLKGGFALDLRLNERARATRDVDIDWRAAKEELIETLLDAAAHDAGDFFAFAIERTGPPEDRLGGAHRFRVTASLARRHFETFLLDVGFHMSPTGDVDTLTTPDLLAFAGLDPVVVRVVPLSLQLAEKLHAYTRSYGPDRPSTRTKDLVDIALVAECFDVDAAGLLAAITQTFSARGTHRPPTRLPEPPTEWRAPFRELAEAVGLPPELGHGHTIAATFLDPLLSGDVVGGRWNPVARSWH